MPAPTVHSFGAHHRQRPARERPGGFQFVGLGRDFGVGGVRHVRRHADRQRAFQRDSRTPGLDPVQSQVLGRVGEAADAVRGLHLAAVVAEVVDAGLRVFGDPVREGGVRAVVVAGRGHRNGERGQTPDRNVGLVFAPGDRAHVPEQKSAPLVFHAVAKPQMPQWVGLVSGVMGASISGSRSLARRLSMCSRKSIGTPAERNAGFQDCGYGGLSFLTGGSRHVMNNPHRSALLCPAPARGVEMPPLGPQAHLVIWRNAAGRARTGGNIPPGSRRDSCACRARPGHRRQGPGGTARRQPRPGAFRSGVRRRVELRAFR